MAPSFCAVVTVAVAVMVAAFASFLHRFSPIDPLPLDLGPLPTDDFWKPEFNLQNMEKIEVGDGPEDVVFDKRGRAYTGCADGWVKRIDVDGKVNNFSYTGGRPLGLAIGGDDPEVMYLADSELGLFEISLSDGTAHFIADKDDEGTRIGLADAVAIRSDGVVYLTDATVKFSFKNHILDVLESRPNGRLLKYDPAAKTISVVKKSLWFANGLALSRNEDFLLICETSRARVLRLWLKGEKEGTLEVFLSSLLGFPDNVKYHDGNFYIGLVGKRSPLTDWLVRNSVGAQLKRILPFIPTPIFELLLSSKSLGRFLVVNEEGQLLKKYEDPTGKVIYVVTGANRHGDYVYVNSLIAPYMGRIKVV